MLTPTPRHQESFSGSKMQGNQFILPVNISFFWTPRYPLCTIELRLLIFGDRPLHWKFEFIKSMKQAWLSFVPPSTHPHTSRYVSQETSPHLFASSLSLSMALGDTLERSPKVARYKRIPKERSETWEQTWDSRWNAIRSLYKRKYCASNRDK